MYNNYFVFDGKQSTEFNLIISGLSTWGSSEYDIDTTEIPGRNGDLLTTGGRYKNFDFEYKDCAITKDFSLYFPDLRAFMLSHVRKYYRLEDTYHNDTYLKACFTGDLDPDYDAYNDAGMFDLKFNAMPQRWLKTGDDPIKLTETKVVTNPTPFTAHPLIKITGKGKLTVGNYEITVSSDCPYEYIYLDSDIYDAYNGVNNCNKYIELKNYSFPVFAGDEATEVSFASTITEVEITPRWWTL